MSVQIQLQLNELAQWSAVEGVTGSGSKVGTVVLSAPVPWRKIYAFRLQYPNNTSQLGLTGYIEFQYIQNSIDRLPNNTDPYRVPVTDDTEAVLYTPTLAQPLQFNLYALELAGVPLDTAMVRLFILHSLT